MRSKKGSLSELKSQNTLIMLFSDTAENATRLKQLNHQILTMAQLLEFSEDIRLKRFMIRYQYARSVIIKA